MDIYRLSSSRFFRFKRVYICGASGRWLKRAPMYPNPQRTHAKLNVRKMTKY